MKVLELCRRRYCERNTHLETREGLFRIEHMTIFQEKKKEYFLVLSKRDQFTRTLIDAAPHFKNISTRITASTSVWDAVSHHISQPRSKCSLDEVARGHNSHLY